MRAAYVDSSCFVAQLFGEPAGPAIAKRIATFEIICASALLEAELRSAAAREQSAIDEDALATVNWIHPAKRLHREITRVLNAGYLKGADTWHLACALYFFENPDGASFLTLDSAQRSVAEKLGFEV